MARFALDIDVDVTEVLDTLGRLCAQMDHIANRLARIDRQQAHLARALAAHQPAEDTMTDTDPNVPEPVDPDDAPGTDDAPAEDTDSDVDE